MLVRRNDIAMARSRIAAQTTEALELYDKVAAEYPNSHIVLTGHSLGGSLAQIVGAIRGAEAVTFNAYGTRDMFKDTSGLNTNKITNYVNEYDAICMANP